MQFLMRYLGKRIAWKLGIQTRAAEDWSPWRAPQLEDERPHRTLVERLTRRKKALPPAENQVDAQARQAQAFFPDDYGRREPPRRFR